MALWRNTGVYALLLVSLLPGFCGAAGHGRGDGVSGAMAGVAVVDMSRIYNQSDAPKEYDKQLVEITGEAQQRAKILVGVSQLNPKDLQEFLTLVGKVKPDEKEQKRLKELQDLSDKQKEELRQLQGKADLTAADKTRLQVLSDQERLFQSQLLPDIREGLRQEVSVRLEEFRNAQMAQIRTVVGQVAKQKGVTHVFDITALVYCENDLTEAVLQRLKKKK